MRQRKAWGWEILLAAAVIVGLPFFQTSAGAADFDPLSLRMMTTAGVAMQGLEGTDAKGATALQHWELVNYGATRTVVDPATQLATTVRDRLAALNVCVGVSALNDQAVNGLTVPIGGCLVAYDAISAGFHYDFRNSTSLATITVNPLNAYALALKPGIDTLLGRLIGGSPPTTPDER